MKKIFLNLYKFSIFGILSFIPLAVIAQSATELDRCKKLAAQFGGVFDWALKDPSYCTLNGILVKVLNLGLGFAGVAAVLFILYGGYMYITAGGNAEQAEGGRKTLTNAIIGLIVVLLAAMMVRIATNFIVGNGSGGPATGSTPPPNGRGNAGQVSGRDQAVINYIQALSFDAPQEQGGQLILRATIDSADISKALAVCSANSITAVPVDINLDGKYIGSANFKAIAGGSGYEAVVSVSSAGLSSGTLQYSTCGAKTYAQSVTIQ